MPVVEMPTDLSFITFRLMRAFLTTGRHCPGCTMALAPLVAKSTCDTICRKIDHEMCEEHDEC